MVALLMNLIRQKMRPDCLYDGEKVPLEPEAVQKLMELAQRHDLTAIVGSALVEQGLVSQSDAQKALQKAVCYAAVLCENNIHQLQWLCQTLEQAQIPFIPLKGSVVREYYPEPWLRSSCDIDILVHEEDLDRAVSVLVSNGCQLYSEKKLHDISLITPGGVHLELHFSLRENVGVMDRVLGQVWENSDPAVGKRFEYRQTGTFLLFHLIAHMAYHCYIGGCGIRSFVDIWLLRDRLNYDRKMLRRLCREAGLEKFYDHALHLIDVWFCNKDHTAISAQLEQYVFHGGTFGSVDNLILVDQAQTGKKKRLYKRIFLPYEGLKTLFPILEKRRWLSPVFQVVRWFSVMTDGRFRSAMRELRTSRSHSDAQIDQTKLFLEQVGLDFT